MVFQGGGNRPVLPLEALQVAGGTRCISKLGRIPCKNGRGSAQETGLLFRTIDETYTPIKRFSANVGFGRIWTEFECRTPG